MRAAATLQHCHGLAGSAWQLRRAWQTRGSPAKAAAGRLAAPLGQQLRRLGAADALLLALLLAHRVGSQVPAAGNVRHACQVPGEEKLDAGSPRPSGLVQGPAWNLGKATGRTQGVDTRLLHLRRCLLADGPAMCNNSADHATGGCFALFSLQLLLRLLHLGAN